MCTQAGDYWDYIVSHQTRKELPVKERKITGISAEVHKTDCTARLDAATPAGNNAVDWSSKLLGAGVHHICH